MTVAVFCEPLPLFTIDTEVLEQVPLDGVGVGFAVGEAEGVDEGEGLGETDGDGVGSSTVKVLFAK